MDKPRIVKVTRKAQDQKGVSINTCNPDNLCNPELPSPPCSPVTEPP